MSSTATIITESLCRFCHQFVDNLFSFNFLKQETYPTPWQPVGSEWTPEKAWGDVFHHYETFDDLSKSAETCEVCSVLHADLAQMSADLRQGWLGLYPFWSTGRMGMNKLKGHFRAGFRDSLGEMPWGSSKIGSIPLHSFRVCRRVPLKEGEIVEYADAHRRLPAVSSTLQPSDIPQEVASWERECSETHKNCAGLGSSSELPTRVIDVGKAENAHIRLYESRGEKAQYATLSHCWGGAIPSVTIQANKAARTDIINIDELPQNFKDAIQVTRALGIPYIWIDALCIIQDSKEDWDREASKMFSVYAGASLTISALDATASTEGFLKPNRVPLAIINDEYGVQKVFPDINEYLVRCPLTTRGWCMQERLLAPRLLHFGKEQIFWECRTDFICEDGRRITGDSDGHVMAEFLRIRRSLGISADPGTDLFWCYWYQLLGEYTTRKLTVPTDKLPAVAGAAALFRTPRPDSTYVAGLWKEDIVRGLLWCAHYDHMPGRRVWGISTTDRISVLTKPAKKRAPSWSWASVDGQLDFWARKIGGFVVEALGVTMDAEREGIASVASGIVKLRGLVTRMYYHPPPDKPGLDVGALTFKRIDSPEDESVTLNGCVMDVDRRSPRFCWAIVMAQSMNDWYLLILHKQNDGKFQRIGMSTSKSVKVDPGRFETKEIEIV
ncbi:HET-domain-containing protein [Hypoxylon trugodes]|uniref:HET-domain-containing protein n=1 Tax=Hypoxylon trugodes TaxID=326681 RepID=UPI0021989B9C|nr:HET-domain-containing protein [Hypoxylon trugodes]KAI1390602.1 HET-domain-containing protein [Hypoxylon trugodes]